MGEFSQLRRSDSHMVCTIGGSIDDVTVNEVTCSVMNMDFFDRITTEGKSQLIVSSGTHFLRLGIAKPSGQIEVL